MLTLLTKGEFSYFAFHLKPDSSICAMWFFQNVIFCSVIPVLAILSFNRDEKIWIGQTSVSRNQEK